MVWFIDVARSFDNDWDQRIPSGRLRARWTSDDELEVLVHGAWMPINRLIWKREHFQSGNISSVREMPDSKWYEQQGESV